jgi:hypothetical protein
MGIFLWPEILVNQVNGVFSGKFLCICLLFQNLYPLIGSLFLKSSSAIGQPQSGSAFQKSSGGEGSHGDRGERDSNLNIDGEASLCYK